MVKSIAPARRSLDRTFAALSDATRRSILEQLAAGPASISELVAPVEISLPGLLKHVRILEQARLVETVKVGRYRHCRLAAEAGDDVSAWVDGLRERWEGRLDRVEQYVTNRRARPTGGREGKGKS
ncbi:MAG: winged helix-turn-helix transcriptional regulator [Actinobacteria bacterium]|nr:winged helix-turn-helix transcriptional regulator [Actinomycetota bacterium]